MSDTNAEADLVTQLREHEDPRLYEEAANLMLDAAIRITDMESRYAGLVKECQAAHRELHLAKVRSAPETWKIHPSPARVTGEILHQAFREDPVEKWQLPASRQAVWNKYAERVNVRLEAVTGEPIQEAKE